jgi:hypothetical protein
VEDFECERYSIVVSRARDRVGMRSDLYVHTAANKIGNFRTETEFFCCFVEK